MDTTTAIEEALWDFAKVLTVSAIITTILALSRIATVNKTTDALGLYLGITGIITALYLAQEGAKRWNTRSENY